MKYIYPYKPASKSANALAEAMGIPVIGKDILLVKGGPNITIINWGNGELSGPSEQCRIINKPDAVNRAINKLAAFQALQASSVPTVDWTTNMAVANSWLASHTKVVARTQLEGKDGSGLVLVGPTDGWTAPVIPVAPLYTKFVSASAEYRINVCGNRTMGVQLKVPINDNHNKEIKTGGNGYGFRLLNSGEIPHGIRPVARAAIAALGLDFGGVDLIVGVDGNPYVLEVNTAPELTPSMVSAYADKLKDM